MKYTWTFESPIGTHLVLKFLAFNIEESENCILDYVEITRGYKNSENPESKAEKICYSNVTLTNFSGNNVMTVQFVTDAYRNESGFSAVVFTGRLLICIFRAIYYEAKEKHLLNL